MFKKLENSFLLMLMITMLVIILASFSTIFFINYKQTIFGITRDFEEIQKIKIASAKIIIRNSEPLIFSKGPQRTPFITFDVVDLKTTNLFASFDFSNNASISEDLYKLVKENNKEKDIIQYQENVWYSVHKTLKNKDSYIFLEITNQYKLLKSLLYSLISIACLLFFVTFIVGKIFAKRMINPVKESFCKQKEFITDASHELRTPLAVISSNLDVVLSNCDKSIESQTKWLFYIKNEVKKMTELTSTLLYLSKSFKEESEKNFSNINLSLIIEGYLLSFEALMFEKGIIINSKIENNLEINADKVQINQLLVILLDNATKYTADKIINLQLSKKNGKIILVVSNKCENINKENINKLFDRFYKVDKSRTGENGYGLGLSIAKSIVENHNALIIATCDANVVTFKVIF